MLTSGGLGFIFDLYFRRSLYHQALWGLKLTRTVWTYGNGLELNSSRFTQPGDFFTYLVFICTTIVVSEHVFIPLPSYMSSFMSSFIQPFNAILLSAPHLRDIDYAPRISARPVIF